MKRKIMPIPEGLKRLAAELAGEKFNPMRSFQKAPADPIRSLFLGVHFHNKDNRDAAIERVSRFCKSESDRIKIDYDYQRQKAMSEMNAERRSLHEQCQILEGTIRQIKRHQAEELIDAIGAKWGDVEVSK